MTNPSKEQPHQLDPYLDRYRRHPKTVVRIDGAGHMTLREAVDAGHLHEVTDGVYRRKGN